MAAHDYLGVGMKFPPQIDPATGRVMTANEDRSVKESIYLILMTRKTERLVRPWFGSRIDSYVFMDTGVTVLTMMARELHDLIMDQEPRLSDVNIDITPQLESGRLVINIGFVVASTHTRDSLVFPYYLDNSVNEESEEFAPQEDFYEDSDKDFS